MIRLFIASLRFGLRARSVAWLLTSCQRLRRRRVLVIKMSHQGRLITSKVSASTGMPTQPCLCRTAFWVPATRLTMYLVVAPLSSLVTTRSNTILLSLACLSRRISVFLPICRGVTEGIQCLSLSRIILATEPVHGCMVLS
jgi:hypothetical protein